MASPGSPQPQQFHDQEPTTTYEAPFHPEIRSIVSSTAAHAQRIYFSGHLVHNLYRNPDGSKPHEDRGWCSVWAELRGTTLSIWEIERVRMASQLGGGVPRSRVNVKEAVRTPFHLHYLRDSTEPSSPAHPCLRFHTTGCDNDVPSLQIYRDHHSQHCWDESPPFLLPFRPRSHFMGCCLPTLVLGEVAPRGDVYGLSHPLCRRRRHEYRLDPY